MSSQMLTGFEPKEDKTGGALTQVAESKEVAETQARYTIAKRFPRDESQAFMKIMKACDRPLLADQAIYAYPKGGQTVSGASIRLAEVLLQSWGNMDCGIKEVSQENGVSIAEAYAIDLETNVRIVKIFHVAHVRNTKKGSYKLTDSRDIYETVANQGSRRLRACILGIIPGDVIDAAVGRCEKTQESSDAPLAERVRKMLVKFSEVGVKREHIEKKLDHSIDDIVAAELVSLTSIYRSIKDGMSDRTDFFDISSDSARDKLKEALGKKD